MQLGGCTDFLRPFYLESYIWPDVTSWWIWQRNSECASNFVGRCNLRVQGYHWGWELDLQLWPWDKATILPMGKSIRTKNLSWQAKQSILHITVMFYGDCVKMCEDFASTFGDKRTGCCITTTHRLTLPFSPGNFLKNNMITVPSHHTFLCFPDWR
jgi:hypothetical protein